MCTAMEGWTGKKRGRRATPRGNSVCFFEAGGGPAAPDNHATAQHLLDRASLSRRSGARWRTLIPAAVGRVGLTWLWGSYLRCEAGAWTCCVEHVCGAFCRASFLRPAVPLKDIPVYLAVASEDEGPVGARARSCWSCRHGWSWAGRGPAGGGGAALLLQRRLGGRHVAGFSHRRVQCGESGRRGRGRGRGKVLFLWPCRAG